MKIAVAGGTGTVGAHVVARARERGHEVVVLSRSRGADLVTGAGLAEALAGGDAVIDVASVQTQSAREAEAFFGAVTAHLLSAEKAARVGHHIALGIIGSDKAPFGYYAGKMRQEQLVEHGDVPWTILRAAQFHEFAQQLHGQVTVGPVMLVPKMVSQPIAAAEVAARLVEIAEAGPSGRVRDLAGPRVESMPAMVKAYAAAVGSKGPILTVPLPGGFGKAMRNGTLLAGSGDASRAAITDLGVQTFDEWLALIPRGEAG